MADYPRGKLKDDDEGELAVRMGVKNATVVIDFGKPIRWIGLGAKEARAWSDKLRELADGIDN